MADNFFFGTFLDWGGGETSTAAKRTISTLEFANKSSRRSSPRLTASNAWRTPVRHAPGMNLGTLFVDSVGLSTPQRGRSCPNSATIDAMFLHPTERLGCPNWTRPPFILNHSPHEPWMHLFVKTKHSRHHSHHHCLECPPWSGMLRHRNRVQTCSETPNLRHPLSRPRLSKDASVLVRSSGTVLARRELGHTRLWGPGLLTSPTQTPRSAYF